jgi:hypothetical protein
MYAGKLVFAQLTELAGITDESATWAANRENILATKKRKRRKNLFMNVFMFLSCPSCPSCRQTVVMPSPTKL